MIATHSASKSTPNVSPVQALYAEFQGAFNISHLKDVLPALATAMLIVTDMAATQAKVEFDPKGNVYFWIYSSVDDCRRAYTNLSAFTKIEDSSYNNRNFYFAINHKEFRKTLFPAIKQHGINKHNPPKKVLLDDKATPSNLERFSFLKSEGTELQLMSEIRARKPAITLAKK